MSETTETTEMTEPFEKIKPTKTSETTEITKMNEITKPIKTSETTEIDEHTLYSDGYITVTSKELIIKNYYFPFAGSLTIPLTEIISVDNADDLNLGLLSMKEWGMPLSNIWFALDFTRSFRPKEKIGVVKVKNQWIRKGFSVKDVRGIDTLKRVWSDVNNQNNQ
ncbi:21140_t:CDS:2 [Gigaspora margarita]|uniref:21140_t:CDS:1 n=1 Tax=Gigaspora margarita TaxID=4874 RepID=A0ABN7V509_GIGMA|nr:21140_t:CDS:2 [Gigaspora margarita]